MKQTRLALLLVLATVGPVSMVSAEPLSDAEIASRLLDEILAPVSEAAREVEAPGIAVFGVPSAAGTESRFFDEVANRLLAGGFDVWLLREGASAPGGALALDLALTESEIDYPQQTRTLLGAGRARVQRRVSLGADMRLSQPETGRLLYVGEPVRVEHEWMSFTDANRQAAVRADWIGAKPVVEVRERNPWWQRAAILGIVGGVAAIYFGGAT